jgi:hypothetical protein
VEHKAQTHLRGFALVSRYFRAVYLAAPMYFNGVHVRHNENRPARAEKAQKGSFRGGAGPMRLYLALSVLVVVFR